MTEQTVAERGADIREAHNTPVHQETRGGQKSSNLRILVIGRGGPGRYLSSRSSWASCRALRQHSDLEAAAAQTTNQTPRVTVVVARKSAVAFKQVLPGSAMPYQEAAIYSRTTGYLKERFVEIGDTIAKDKLLAVIATPEIDAQLELARATLLQTKDTLKRDEAMRHWPRPTWNGPKNCGGKSKKASPSRNTKPPWPKLGPLPPPCWPTCPKIKANDAEIHRLEALQSFQQVKAPPFAGVITAKNVDPGRLVTADSPNTTKELFHLMQVDVLRVFVNVPQVYAANVKVGQTAAVYQRDDPQQKFPGKVTRTANALDPSTRTMLTEVQVANPKVGVVAGHVPVQVQFTL